MANEMLILRRQELSRRVENLPAEVEVWKTATEDEVDKNAYFSQIRAIEVLMKAFVSEQRTMLADLDPSGNFEPFNVGSLNLIRSVIRAQKVWETSRLSVQTPVLSHTFILRTVRQADCAGRPMLSSFTRFCVTAKFRWLC